MHPMPDDALKTLHWFHATFGPHLEDLEAVVNKNFANTGREAYPSALELVRGWLERQISTGAMPVLPGNAKVQTYLRPDGTYSVTGNLTIGPFTEPPPTPLH